MRFDACRQSDSRDEHVMSKALAISDRGEPYEANGGGFNNALGRLRTYELVDAPRGELCAAKEFFE